ncbi:hypothetical protein APHAL10511_004368 [Amanita phalloides]|nr:hypothetical protein APHAL10511_004368 [Amanita phalloides]
MAALFTCVRTAVLRALHTQAAAPSSGESALHFIRSQPSQYVVATFAGKKLETFWRSTKYTKSAPATIPYEVTL